VNRGLVARASYGRVLWLAWTAYTRRAGVYQSRVLLNAIYFVVFGPCALAARLVGVRLLDIDPRPRSSYWSERRPTNTTLDDLKRQF
jgi:hypothetical protein